MWFLDGQFWLGKHKVLNVLVIIEKAEIETVSKQMEVFYLEDKKFSLAE